MVQSLAMTSVNGEPCFSESMDMHALALAEAGCTGVMVPALLLSDDQQGSTSTARCVFLRKRAFFGASCHWRALSPGRRTVEWGRLSTPERDLDDVHDNCRLHSIAPTCTTAGPLRRGDPSHLLFWPDLGA